MCCICRINLIQNAKCSNIILYLNVDYIYCWLNVPHAWLQLCLHTFFSFPFFNGNIKPGFLHQKHILIDLRLKDYIFYPSRVIQNKLPLLWIYWLLFILLLLTIWQIKNNQSIIEAKMKTFFNLVCEHCKTISKLIIMMKLARIYYAHRYLM